MPFSKRWRLWLASSAPPPGCSSGGCDRRAVDVEIVAVASRPSPRDHRRGWRNPGARPVRRGGSRRRTPQPRAAPCWRLGERRENWWHGSTSAPRCPRPTTGRSAGRRRRGCGPRRGGRGELAAEAALDQALRGRVRADSLAVQGHLSPAQREEAELLEATRRREAEAARARAATAAHDVERARAALLLAAPGPAACARDGRRSTPPSPAGYCGSSRKANASCRPARRSWSRRSLTARDGRPICSRPMRCKVRPGDTVLVEQWGGGQALRARVRTGRALGVHQDLGAWGGRAAGERGRGPGRPARRPRVTATGWKSAWCAGACRGAQGAAERAGPRRRGLERCSWYRAGGPAPGGWTLGHRGAFEVEVDCGAAIGRADHSLSERADPGWAPGDGHRRRAVGPTVRRSLGRGEPALAESPASAGPPVRLA